MIDNVYSDDVHLLTVRYPFRHSNHNHRKDIKVLGTMHLDVKYGNNGKLKSSLGKAVFVEIPIIRRHHTAPYGHKGQCRYREFLQSPTSIRQLLYM